MFDMEQTAVKNFQNLMMHEGSQIPVSQISELMEKLTNTGIFIDLDYNSQDRNNWHCTTHAKRTVCLLSNPEVLKKSALRRKALAALSYWLDQDWANPNWWHNDIGLPQNIGKAALLAEPWLTPDQKERAKQLASKGSFTHLPRISGWTGANLRWGVIDTVQYALLSGDLMLARPAIALAEREVSVKDGDAEGIKPDYSFFQHSTQFYSGGYGRSFVIELSSLVYILQESPLQFSTSALKVFADFVLDGLRWMTQKNSLDFMTVGREICRTDALKLDNMQEALWRLSNSKEMPRAEELAEFYRQVRGWEALHPEGDRWFPYAHMYVCRHTGRYLSSRVTAPGQMLGETINGENFYSANLYTGGVICTMPNGGEYDNLMPVWDFCRIPGSTARIETDDALMEKRAIWHGKMPENQYGCGEILDEMVGCIWQDMKYNGVSGVIARFFIDGMLVALGSDLCASGAEPIVTTLEQCRLEGSLRQERCAGHCAIRHNGTVYALLDSHELQFDTQMRTGNWKRINESESAPPVTEDVLTVWIDHGTAPANASYAFAILSEAMAEQKLASVKVLANTSQCQAIEWNGYAYCVFHQTGNVILPGGKTITGEVSHAQKIKL